MILKGYNMKSNKNIISQKDVLAGMRKSMPPPSSSFKDKKKYDRKKERINFKDYYREEMGTLGSASTNPGDFSHVAETMYADGQDETTPSVQSLADNVDREQLIQDIIGDLEELKTSFPWTEPLEDSVIKAMAQTLRQVGVEPTDLDAAVGKPAKLQKQYLITGPSSWKGGNGALNDLKAILAGNEPQEITNEQQELTPEDIHDLADRKKIIWDEDPNFMRLTQKLTGKKHLDDLNQEELRIMRDYLEGLEEDESNPAADLAMGSTSAGDPLSEVMGDNFQELFESVTLTFKENFMDKKGPGRSGDSKRHGIKKGTSLSKLDKIVKSKTASPRKKQLAHWQANMRRGKAKKRR
jgi:hypothetical protein